MDEDLDRMTHAELMAEAKKLRHGIRMHRDSSRHELCWHHPGLWGLLPEKTDPIPLVPEWPRVPERLHQVPAIPGPPGGAVSTDQRAVRRLTASRMAGSGTQRGRTRRGFARLVHRAPVASGYNGFATSTS